MGTFIVKASRINKSFEVVTDAMIVVGNYTIEEKSNELQIINASCYRNQQGKQGDLVGTFNGLKRGDGVRYTLTEMAKADIMAVADIIEDIEHNILES
jgi:hypothetical protein